MVEIGITPVEEGEALAEAASLRNRLAHRYLDQKWPAIRDFLDTHLEVIRRFIERSESIALASADKLD